MDVLLRQKDGSLVRADIPADQVAQGFLGGSVLFHRPDQRVPVRAPDGSIGSIPASSASHALRSGYSVVSDEEYHKAYLDNTYGGTGAGIEAGAAGLARGISARLSDAAIVQGAKYYGGSTYANQVRKRLGELQEARPYISGISEGAGVLAGALATGGDSAAAEAGAGGALEQAAGQLAERDALPAAADAAAAESAVSPVAKATSLGERSFTPPRESLGLQTLDKLDAAAAARSDAGPLNYDKPSITDHVLSNLDKIRESRSAADEMEMAAKAEGGPPLRDLISDHPPRVGEPGAPPAPEPVMAGEVPTPPPGVSPPSWAESVQRPASMPEAAEHIASRIDANPPSLARQILANSPTGLITRAGRAAEGVAQKAVEELFGKQIAESATGRILTSAIKYGASGALENGLYQMGNEVDESTLGDTDIAGEKLLAAFGHGALMGSAFGFGLGGAGAVGREIGTSILRKVAPNMYDLSRLQAYRAFGGVGSQRAATKELIRAGFGERGVYEAGDAALRFKILDGAPDAETRYSRVVDAREGVGRRIGDLAEGADAVAQKGDLPTIKELQGAMLDESNDKINFLHQYREATGNVLGLTSSERGELKELIANQTPKLEQDWLAARNEYTRLDAIAKKVAGTAPEIEAARVAANDAKVVRDNLLTSLRSARSRITELTRINDNSFFNELMAGVKRAANEDGTISISSLRKERTRLDDLARNWTPNPYGPMEAPRQLLIKHMRGVMEDAVVDALDRVGGKVGKQLVQEYNPLKKDYRLLRFLEKKAESSLVGHLNNQHISLTGKMLGLSVFAHGGVHGIPAALAATAMHKIVRDRGTAASAIILEKLNQLAFIQKNISKVDKAMDAAAESVVARASGKEGRRLSLRGIRVKGLVGPEETESPTETRDNKIANMTKVTELAALPSVKAQHLNAALGGENTHVPETAGSLATAANSATQFLLSALPRRAAQFNDITGPKVGRISDMELDQFHNQYEGASDFYRLMNKISSGRSTPQHREAFQKTKPLMASQFSGILAAKLAALKPEEREAIPYQSQMELWVHWGIPVSWSQDPSAIKILNATDVQISQSDGRPMNAVEPKPGRQAPSRFKGVAAQQMQIRSDQLETGQLGDK